MSNITFMIGNGFDLACGLKSRYVDTYDGYIIRSSSSLVIEKFKNTIQKNILTWADFELQLAEYAKDLKSETELIACLRDYDEFLNDYLLSEQKKFWDEYGDVLSGESYILQEMGQSLAQFYNGLTVNDVRGIDIVFKRDPNIHFNFISFNYTNLFDTFLQKTVDSGYLATNLQYRFSCSNVLHIHGALGSDVTLGIDNENQLKGLSYGITNRAKRVLIKPVFLQNYDKNRLSTAREIITNSDIICVFGLSLGDSDLIWREQLAQWLKEDNNHHLIYYKHSNILKTYHSTALTKKMDDEEDGKAELFALLFDEIIEEEKKAEIISRIHIPVGMKLFNIEHAMSEARLLSQQKNELKAKLSSAKK